MDDIFFNNEGNVLSALTYNGEHLNSELQGKAWVGHMQFAYWIVSVLKPNVLVELGTHGGCSYFSFCDSVKNSNLKTKAYAVDTWEGEEHSGKYNQTVYDFVYNYNNKYSSFSSLLKMKFDHALDLFEEHSVDILHIDGFHSYEAVSHDFESWLEKLSQEGAVLFHDIKEVREGFGVHKYWDELKEKYPFQYIEFNHSHGLGVLFPKSITALNTLEKSLVCTLEELIKLFTLVGDQTYYLMNGHYTMKAEVTLNLQQLVKLLQSIRSEQPELSKKLKELL